MFYGQCRYTRNGGYNWCTAKSTWTLTEIDEDGSTGMTHDCCDDHLYQIASTVMSPDYQTYDAPPITQLVLKRVQ